MRINLGVQVGDMALHGAQADHQFVCDLLVAPARRDEAQNLDFAVS